MLHNGAMEHNTPLISTIVAGLVLAPKTEAPMKYIEFVNLKPGRALVVMVDESGGVENRLIEVPRDLPASALVEAGNFLV